MRIDQYQLAIPRDLAAGIGAGRAEKIYLKYCNLRRIT